MNPENTQENQYSGQSFTPNAGGESEEPFDYYWKPEIPDPDVMDRAFGEQSQLLLMQDQGMITPEWLLENQMSMSDLPKPLTEEELAMVDGFQAFQATYAQLLPAVGEYKKEIFKIESDKIDQWGYPMMNQLPDLYGFLWHNYSYMFDPNSGWWTVQPDEVMSIIGDYWRVAEFKERMEEEYEKQMKEYESAMEEYEQYQKDQEEAEEKNIDAMFKFGLNAKQSKKKMQQ